MTKEYDIFEHVSPALPRVIVLKVKSVYKSLKTAERRAADYLLLHPEDYAHCIIDRLSEKACCSQATIVRFVKRLGYAGFLEFRQQIFEETPLLSGIEDEVQEKGDDIDHVFLTAARSLYDTLSIMDKKACRTASKLIQQAGCVLALGIGEAAGVAFMAYRKFLRIGINIRHSFDFETLFLEATHLQENDVLLIICHQGRKRCLDPIIRLAHERSVKIILITGFPFSPMAKLADAVLLTSVLTLEAMGETMTRSASQICMIEALYNDVSANLDEKARLRLNEANALLTDSL